MFDQAGNVIRVAGIAEDITEERRAEEALAIGLEERLSVIAQLAGDEDARIKERRRQRGHRIVSPGTGNPAFSSMTPKNTTG